MVTHKEAIEKALETWIVANDMFEDYERKAMEAAIRAYLDARGRVMVPKEPDGEMTAAGKRSRNAAALFTADDAYHAYRAMLAAAPDPFREAKP